MRARGPIRFPAWRTVVLLAVLGCATVPYTQRNQFIVMSEAEEVQLGAQAYDQVLKDERIVRDPALVEPVRRVGQRIAAVADRPDYAWDFRVVDDGKNANAFALPGGKVAVYTGLFPVAQNEAGLAAVLGHEVAHALARHAGERMSNDLLLQIGTIGLSTVVGDASPMTQTAILQAFGLGAQIGLVLPFGRSQESEADRIGLILMAKAGYDPEAALGLWQRMEEQAHGAPPEFLSTHPSYGTRQSNIRAWTAEARSYYRPGADSGDTRLPVVNVKRGVSQDAGPPGGGVR